MKATLAMRIRKLRAAFALLLLLVTSLSTPAALAFGSEGNGCAMACCVADGYCCCNLDRETAEGELPKDEKTFEKSEVSSPCPAGCTNPPSTLKIQSRVFARTASHQIGPVSAIITAYQTITAELRGIHRSSSPRAPPSPLL